MANFNHVCHRAQGLQDLHSCIFCDSWWLQRGWQEPNRCSDWRKREASPEALWESAIPWPAYPGRYSMLKEAQIVALWDNQRYGENWRYQGKSQREIECIASKRQRKTRERRVLQGRKVQRGDRIKICGKLSFVSSTAHKIILFYLCFSE